MAKVQQLAQKIQSNGSSKCLPHFALPTKCRFASLESTKIINVLHRSAGQVAAFDIGFRPFNDYTSEAKKQTKFLYLLGADDQPISREQFADNVFIVYQGLLLYTGCPKKTRHWERPCTVAQLSCPRLYNSACLTCPLVRIHPRVNEFSVIANFLLPLFPTDRSFCSFPCLTRKSTAPTIKQQALKK